MELQSVYGKLREAGWALYAVSYDSVEVLAGFAARYGIEYPLLSDDGSKVIRSLGLLNEEANENVFGIPHPGVFVLDGEGRVTQKAFYRSYRERDTGTGLLEHVLGIASEAQGVPKERATSHVEARAWLDRPTYAWGQRVWLNVELTMAPGIHIYSRPIPDGYCAVEVRVEPIERVSVGEPRWPATTPFAIEGLDESFAVYSGTVRVSVPITFMVVDAGRLTVNVEIAFQACSERECFPPESVHFALAIDERPLIERPQARG